MSYSESEWAMLRELPTEVQALTKQPQYESLFANYCIGKLLNDLAPGSKINWCEFYYGSDIEPALFFSDGKLTSINLDEVSDPATLQIFGANDVLYIRVEGHVILNRTKNAQMPDWKNLTIAQQVSELMGV